MSRISQLVEFIDSEILPDAVKDLQVSGSRCFPENRWRESVLYYLFGVWGNKQEVMYRPKINFGNFTLRLCPDTGMYYTYGKLDWHGNYHRLERQRTDGTLVVSCDQNSVEVGLARFVKDDKIGQLTIEFPPSNWSPGKNCALQLRKTSRRGELMDVASDVPTFEQLSYRLNANG